MLDQLKVLLMALVVMATIVSITYLHDRRLREFRDCQLHQDPC